MKPPVELTIRDLDRNRREFFVEGTTITNGNEELIDFPLGDDVKKSNAWKRAGRRARTIIEMLRGLDAIKQIVVGEDFVTVVLNSGYIWDNAQKDVVSAMTHVLKLRPCNIYEQPGGWKRTRLI